MEARVLKEMLELGCTRFGLDAACLPVPSIAFSAVCCLEERTSVDVPRAIGAERRMNNNNIFRLEYYLPFVSFLNSNHIKSY